MSIPLISAAPKPFKGCYLQSEDFVYPASAVTYTSWSVVAYDTDGFFNADNDTRITIPAGVKKIRFQTFSELSMFNNEEHTMIVRKNGAGMQLPNVNMEHKGKISEYISPIIDVEEGDYFDRGIYHGYGSARNGHNERDYFALEVIE